MPSLVALIFLVVPYPQEKGLGSRRGPAGPILRTSRFDRVSRPLGARIVVCVVALASARRAKSQVGHLKEPCEGRQASFREVSHFGTFRVRVGSEPNLSDDSDSVFWRWHSSGLFSTALMYSILVDRGVHDWRADRIWKSKGPLKMKLVLWLVLKKRLETKDRLLNHRVLQTDPGCVFCNKEPKIIWHLFSGCRACSLGWNRFLSHVGEMRFEIIPDEGNHLMPVSVLERAVLLKEKQPPSHSGHTSSEIYMLRCHCRRWLSPLAPRSSLCRLRRLSFIIPPSPFAAMGEGDGKAKSKVKASPVSTHRDEAYLNSVIQKRIHLFESIQAQQKAERLKVDGEPIKVTLPDGTIKEGKKWLTSPMDIAKEISAGLAASALIAQVNGTLWDMTRPLEGDSDLKIFKFDDHEGRDTFWHSSAHILGQSLEMEYGCKLCIGPCTTRGEGFYYDAFYDDLTLNEEHFSQIQSRASKAAGEKQPFERIEVSREQALEMFAENKFKVEIINELPEDKTITVYRCGPLVDLCRGPHIPNTSFVKAFACLKASSSYWRGKSDRESLQRVYGISFPDSKRLKEYLTLLEEAKKRDHRILGQNQDLFFFHPLSPGSCFFLPHGTRIYNKLIDFLRAQYRDRGYQEVLSPNIYNMQLWETSGHAANYKENMFVFEIEKQEFGLKPMNCPGHCLMFEHRVRSYRELPLRLADFGVLHRNELSGALTGLTRVRRFQQDDAHIFCRESQIKEEVKNVLDFISYTYGIFGFTFELELSTRPEKFLGEIETWNKAEAALSEALNEFGRPWQINEGDGAFYGPKIDIGVFDALKRKFQCATLQLDFQLPLRFKLTYSAEDEAKLERPVMIHRAILGSVERMFAILLEHYKGKWPFWLSPRQAIVCPVSEKSQNYAEQVREKIHQAGYYVDADLTDRKIQKKVREAQLAQYNYILVVGEEEAKTGQVSVRVRDGSDHSVMSLEALLEHFKKEIEAFH
ncbi:threonine--tRNA ligase, mitochondrial 1 [Canna indica]|uniref:threonine--tRNA ligase n=1 Tax=Canna indica TaxID=4628 RepID=A0AAQ3KYA4_9LILI|nr:threonine--tRNA ligase, mitochondrial 1 [Canna indica]